MCNCEGQRSIFILIKSLCVQWMDPTGRELSHHGLRVVSVYLTVVFRWTRSVTAECPSSSQAVCDDGRSFQDIRVL